jgi:hypothetical protein
MAFNVFGPFDKQVDPKLKEAMDKLDNAGSVIASAINFESSFVGTSAGNASARINKILTDLVGEERLFKQEFDKKDLHAVDSNALDTFSGGCTRISSDKYIIVEVFSNLHKVSNSVMEAINIILHSGKVNTETTAKLEAIKSSEFNILKLSDSVKSTFNNLFRDVDGVSRDIDDGINNAKDWENVKVAALKMLTAIEQCEKDVSSITSSLRKSFTLLKDAITIDQELKKEIQTHLNIITHGSADGKKQVYSGEAFTAKDRKGELMAYASDLDKQEKNKKRA